MDTSPFTSKSAKLAITRHLAHSVRKREVEQIFFL